MTCDSGVCRPRRKDAGDPTPIGLTPPDTTDRTGG